jgi:Methane oxygenase PmoA
MTSSTLRIHFRKLYALATFIPFIAHTQPLPIKVEIDSVNSTAKVTVDGKPFTTFFFPDTLEKPVLYPIYAPNGQLITRGFPLEPRPGEPTDHPHHIGLWFNYENVNGLDFWNNSYAIPAERKKQYGWIHVDAVQSGTVGKNKGGLIYTANWTDQQGAILLKEKTKFVFWATAHIRIIDRITTLTAETDIHMPDAKDGLLGLRVTKELQIPSSTPGEFFDGKGNITKTAAGNTPDINGTYVTSEGKKGDSAWGTRGNWCILYGKKGGDMISIAIIDHPSNPGYPTYWHARGYGLFAANPLGQRIFSKGAETLDFHFDKGQSVTFRYRIVITADRYRLLTGEIRLLADEFARSK